MAKERRDNKNRLLWKGEYQKSDGRYMFKYTDSTGKPGYVYSWTLTKTDRVPKGKKSGPCLRDLEKEIFHNTELGIDVSNNKSATVNDYFEKHLELHRKLKNTTRRNYRYLYDSYIRSDLGLRKLSSVKYSDVYKLYNTLIYEDGIMVSSLGTVNSVMSSIFKLAVYDNVIHNNPVSGVYSEIKKCAEEQEYNKKALTVSQQKALIDFVRKHPKYYRWYSLVVFLLGTGCRIGEACGITWDDCDFANNIIHIRRTLCYYPDEVTGKCSFFFQKPKTNSGIRDIPMIKDVKRALQDERVNQIQNGFNLTNVEGITGLVFMTKSGNAVAPRTFNYALDEIIKGYNSDEKLKSIGENRQPNYISDISPHIFRHTFCTRLCESNIDIAIIQKIMGHSSITITMDIYNNITEDHKKNEFTKINSLIKVC